MGEGGVEAGSSATAEGADPRTLVAQEHAVEQGLTHATEELGQEVAPAQALVLGVLHLEGDSETNTGGREGLNRGSHEEHGVVADVAEVGDGDAHDADVHTGEDEHGIGSSKDCDGEEAERGVADDLEEACHTVAEHAAQRSQDVELQRDHEEDGEEGTKDGTHGVGHDTVDPLLKEGEHGDAQQDGDERLAIAKERHRDLGAEEREAGLATHEGRKARLKQGCAEHRTEVRVGTKLLRSREAGKDGHEVEAGVVHHVAEEHERAVSGHQVEERGAEDGAEGLEETGGHQDRDQRNNRAGEVVEHGIEHVLGSPLELGGRVVEVLVDGAATTDTELGQLVVHLGHGRPDDDLVHAALLHDAQDTLDGLDVLVHGHIVVHEVEAQARRAMDHLADVFLATDRSEHVSCDLLVVCRVPFLPFPFEAYLMPPVSFLL